MGREHDEQGEKKQSLRNKAAHFVSDMTTALLNPISDNPSSQGDLSNSKNSPSDTNGGFQESIDGPDTSSFPAFLYSFIASSEPHSNSSNSDKKPDTQSDETNQSSVPILTRENTKKKSLYSRGKNSLGKAFSQAAKISGFRNQSSRGAPDMAVGNGSDSNSSSKDEGICMKTLKEPALSENLPETSEPSLLLSEKNRSVLYAELPVIVQGRKWVLLYSTWRHGISLSTLYRRSMIWPGQSLLVVGDRKGAVFGGLVEAPLRPTNTRRYQGSNSTFVFTNISGHPLIFRSTGMNRYFTLCSTEYLAMGGGGHFALYLDGDLLSGSSSSSETYANPCLSNSENFEVKEVELWGFVYASKYEETIALSHAAAPGIHQWK